MNEMNRPDPDILLRRLRAEEQEKLFRRGRLKIFLGANAGVGKTYRMLVGARLQKEAGVDVVVGIAETHGRKDTEDLLHGLEIFSRRKIDYNGIELEELDLDGLLARRPKLALVDELAHTNAPGSRHAKRYQDVEELLNSGINVYTTLNIQHVESLNDLVYQITGIRVQETVPDRILEMVTGPDDIELVDLPPQELLQRLREGKVYLASKAEQASEQFFRMGNLIALREMALRYTARVVDQNKRSYMEQYAIQGPWAVTSRILVCFGSSKLSEQVLRLAKQLSPGIGDEWYAVHIQSPLQARLSQSAQEQLTRNVNLAESLGGKVVFLTGPRIAEEILTFARWHNVSLILVGWSPQWRWSRLFQGSLVDTLVKRSGSEIQVMVVTGAQQNQKSPADRTPRNSLNLSWKSFLGIAACLAVTVGFCFLAQSWLQFVNIAMILLLPVIAGGAIWGKQAGIIASILAVLALDFFFVPPRFSFAVSDLSYLPSFFVFFVVGMGTSFFVELVGRQEDNAKQSEEFVFSLYNLSRQLLSVNNVDELLQQASTAISQAFHCEVQFLLPDGLGRLDVRAKVCPVGAFNQQEWGVADWVFQHGQPAGHGTDTLSSAKFQYIPLKTQTSVVGVLGVCLMDAKRSLTTEQTHLLEAFANIVAISLARVLRLR